MTRSYARFIIMDNLDLSMLSNSEELLADGPDIERASRSLKAMSHPIRLKILCILGADEVNVQDIVHSVGTSQSNVSQHLSILRDKGILTARKDANRVYYRVGDARTLQLIRMMREVFCYTTNPVNGDYRANSGVDKCV
jgi:ArsR family transcriptional regulator